MKSPVEIEMTGWESGSPEEGVITVRRTSALPGGIDGTVIVFLAFHPAAEMEFTVSGVNHLGDGAVLIPDGQAESQIRLTGDWDCGGVFVEYLGFRAPGLSEVQRTPKGDIDPATFWGTPPADFQGLDRETPEQRLSRYGVLWGVRGVQGQTFEDFAAKVEFQEMAAAASNWNYNSPNWAPGYQCYEQWQALRRYLANHFRPQFWDLVTVGGSKWNFGIFSTGIRNHNVLGVLPKDNNPLPAMYIDPFKYFTPDTNIRTGFLSAFRKEYPWPVRDP